MTEEMFLHTSDAGDRAPLTSVFLLDSSIAAESIQESGGMLELCGNVVLPGDKVLVKERGNGSPISSITLCHAPKPRLVADLDCIDLLGGFGAERPASWAIADPSGVPTNLASSMWFSQSVEPSGGFSFFRRLSQSLPFTKKTHLLLCVWLNRNCHSGSRAGKVGGQI